MTVFQDPDFHLIPMPDDGGPTRNLIVSATVYSSPGEAFAIRDAILARVDEKLIVLPMVVCTVPDVSTLGTTGRHSTGGYRIISCGGLDPVLASLQGQALREAAAILASGVSGGF